MAKYAARGTTLGRGTVVGTYVTVAQIRTVGGPELSRGTIDVTDMASTLAEFVGDIADAGEVTLDLIFDPGNVQHINVRSDAESGTLRYWKITWPTSPAASVEFGGIVTRFGAEAAHDGALTGSASVKISGALTWV